MDEGRVGRLAGHSYGKEGIRIVTRWRRDGVAMVRDLTLGVLLSGDFGPAFVAGDNSTTLPTDSMRNHAYAVARELSPDAEPERLGTRWLGRLLDAVPVASQAAATIEIHPWLPSPVGGRSVLERAPWTDNASVTCDRSGAVATTGGVSELMVMAPYSGGFAGFLRDEMTDQMDSRDRILCARVDATWRYRVRDPDIGFSAVRRKVRRALTDSFGIVSSGTQGTVYAMAEAALREAVEVDEITVGITTAPHSPTANDAVWSLTAGPSGVTEATVRRV